MAGGAPTAAAHGGRRALDFELNMVPMIDLLMVTISFLLLTAVWTHSARIDADARAPATPSATPPAEVERLHVDMTEPTHFTLRAMVGPTVVRTRDVARAPNALRFPELARALRDEPPGELVLHTANDLPYAALIGAIDAAYDVKRPCGARATCPAFHVTFASQ